MAESQVSISFRDIIWYLVAGGVGMLAYLVKRAIFGRMDDDKEELKGYIAAINESIAAMSLKVQTKEGCELKQAACKNVVAEKIDNLCEKVDTIIERQTHVIERLDSHINGSHH